MEESTNNNGKKVRSNLLTFLCILTFIGSGLGSFTFLMVYLSYDDMQVILEDMKDQYPQVMQIFRGGPQFFITSAILYFISLMGAVQMWNLRKIGFHMYAAAQIFLLIVPVVTIDASMVSMVEILITGAFIIGYYSQVKRMS